MRLLACVTTFILLAADRCALLGHLCRHWLLAQFNEHNIDQIRNEFNKLYKKWGSNKVGVVRLSPLTILSVRVQTLAFRFVLVIRRRAARPCCSRLSPTTSTMPG